MTWVKLEDISIANLDRRNKPYVVYGWKGEQFPRIWFHIQNEEPAYAEHHCGLPYMAHRIMGSMQKGADTHITCPIAIPSEAVPGVIDLLQQALKATS